MSIKELNSEMIEPLVIGGCILGGGGGGAINEGLKIAELAFEVGTPSLITLDELREEDIIITVSAVGAPAAKNQFVQPMDYVEAVKLLEKAKEISPMALITNENGGIATVNGFFQSAVTGIPVLDASCNGRAHPTGVMGAMQLNEVEKYNSIQSAVGGKPNSDFRLRQILQGNLNTSSHMVRQASISAGGLIAVARNPVQKTYLNSHGAINALSHAYKIGLAHQSGKNNKEKMENVATALNGEIILSGEIKELVFETIDGFDLGKAIIQSGKESIELTIWNEYITCENLKGDRVATFPDLLMTFDNESGCPVTSAEIKKGQEVTVIYTSRDNLILGSGMRLESNYGAVEKVVEKEILKYIQDVFSKEVLHSE
ncbi:DUF917 family protein [Salinicoccus albus]|uniref:S-methyl thiohydantoin desulfurase domain-containing protein n=1 Tax=Salinicoccus albus TaxID=418756 RepID=UPI000382B29E|nr:DUF917 family protein [Salinicoccus albus]